MRAPSLLAVPEYRASAGPEDLSTSRLGQCQSPEPLRCDGLLLRWNVECIGARAAPTAYALAQSSFEAAGL